MSKRGPDRRSIERRAAKRGVTVRHDDDRPDETKRVKRGRFVLDKSWITAEADAISRRGRA